MKLFSARKITPKQQDKYVEKIAEAVVGKDAKEARKALYALHDEVMAQVEANAVEQGIDPDDHRLVVMNLDFRGLNDVAMFTLFPYTPDFEPGVVPPTGGPFDWTPEERFRRGREDFQTHGQLKKDDFKRRGGGSTFVTASVEGFEEPVKMRLKIFRRDKDFHSPVTSVLGYAIIDDIEYVWALPRDPWPNNDLVAEGKRWERVGEDRPLSGWQKDRLAPKPQLTKNERRQVDAAVLSAIREYNSDAVKSRAYGRGQSLMQLADLKVWWSSYGYGNDFEWEHEDLSDAAKQIYWAEKDNAFHPKALRNALSRLLRSKAIIKLEGGNKSEYALPEDAA